MPVLKGEAFASRLREIFDGPLPSVPWPTLSHRRILVPGLTGGEHQWALLGCLAQALRIRGAEVTALMCDAMLPACTLRKADHHESACTRWCYRHAGPFARAVGLPHLWYGDLIDAGGVEMHRRHAAGLPRETLLDETYRDVALREHLLRSLESYFRVGAVDLADPTIEAKARDFVAAARILVDVAHDALEKLAIDKVLLDDGKKTDWGIFRAVAAARGVPVDVTMIGIRNTSVRFEVDRPPHGPAQMPHWSQWRELSLTAAQESDLDEYMARRERVPYEYRGSEWHSGLTDPGEARRLLGLPTGGRVVAMFPNVGFDAGKTKSSLAAFPTATEWMAATLEVLAGRSDVDVVLKGHPAELHRAARESVVTGALQRFETLPPNVHVIPPDTDLSAQCVTRLADVVLTYTSTVTAEAAALGRPVILAGGGWHAGRGVAVEAHEPDAYAGLIRRVAGGWTPPHDTELGRRYAYSLFFRNDIPVTHYRRDDVHVAELLLRDAGDLAPGGDESIDAMCRGILRDEPFENPRTHGPVEAIAS